jgi:glycosyltransferase involved in cell wall biosynthesis
MDPLAPLLMNRNIESLVGEYGCNVFQAFDSLIAGLACYLAKLRHPQIPMAVRLGANHFAHFSFKFRQPLTQTVGDIIKWGGQQGLLLPILPVLEGTVLRTADVVIANCEYLQTVYKSQYPKIRNVVVIRNGVNTNKFRPDGPRENLTENRLWLLYAGRIEERKGLHILLEAMSQISRRFPTARLLLVGRAPDPNYQSCLENLASRFSISSKVKFIGPVDNQMVSRLMRSVDILVFPSTTHGDEVEGLPNTLLEGLATGLPVVATSICGVPEVINNEHNGLLVRPGSSDEMASSVATLIDSPSIRSELGERGREYVVQNNSMEVTARKYLTLYQMLIRGGH